MERAHYVAVTSEGDQAAESSEATAKPDGTTKFLLWFFVGIPALLFGGCMALVVSSSGDDDEPSDGMARVMCEGFVEDRLKSPGSADFQRPITTEVGVDMWRVSGSVDAQNSFGATVRIDYDCTVRGDGDGEWTLVDMQHSE